MQQELIKKKREIIETFLKSGVLISSELLKKIDDNEQISKIFEILKTQKIDEIAVAGIDVNKLISEQHQQTNENDQQALQHKDKIKIIFSYKDDSKKRDPQDFVDYFNNRYRAIEKILKQRQGLKNTVSINRILNPNKKENISIIGIVSHKQLTKTATCCLFLKTQQAKKKY